MKNEKSSQKRKATIKKRLMTASLLILIVASLSGLLGIVVTSDMNTKYTSALKNYGYSQGDIGMAMTALANSGENLQAIVSLDSAAEVQAKEAELTKSLEDVANYMDQVVTTLETDAAKQSAEDFTKTFETYKSHALDFAERGANASASEKSALSVEIEEVIRPEYQEAMKKLNNVMELKVNRGNELIKTLTTTSKVALGAAVILILGALVILVVVIGSLSRNIVIPIQQCTERLKLLAKGNLAAPVPEVSGVYEAEEVAESLHTIVFALSTIVKDEEQLLSGMGNGDFTVRSQCAELYIGDFAPLLVSINGICYRLNDTLQQIVEASAQVDVGAEQVSSGAQSLSQGSTEQASSVQELAATINDISSQISRNAENAKNANELSNHVGVEINESNQHMVEMTTAMAAIGEASNQIGKIIKTIEDIAFQTNILALNAAVEAARAGSAGKGFAVVADEVRNLAGKSQDAAQNTTALIENAISAVENGTQIADVTANSMNLVVENAQKVMELIDSISVASKEQSESVSQVTQGIDQISSVVQTNSATAEESAAASEELSGQSRLLKDLIGTFKILGRENMSSNMAGADNYGQQADTTHVRTNPASMGDKY